MYFQSRLAHKTQQIAAAATIQFGCDVFYYRMSFNYLEYPLLVCPLICVNTLRNMVLYSIRLVPRNRGLKLIHVAEWKWGIGYTPSFRGVAQTERRSRQGSAGGPSGPALPHHTARTPSYLHTHHSTIQHSTIQFLFMLQRFMLQLNIIVKTIADSNRKSLAA